MNSLNQDLFLKEAKEGKNIFLTGKAGTGKTFIVKRAIDLLTSLGKQVLVVAPTGIAANNAGGQTIHSLFSVEIHGVLTYKEARFVNSGKRSVFKKAEVIVIDEVSMLRPDILDVINYTLLKNGCGSLLNKQVIFVGDLKQLPAPIDDNTKSKMLEIYKGLEFNFAKIYDKLNVKEIELEKVHRQTDLEFIQNLNIVRSGNKSEYFRRFVSKNATGIILAPHNSTVKLYNDKGLKSIDSNEIIYTAIIEGKVTKSDFNVEREIRVKVGAKIMYLVNSKNNNLVNGTLGIFELKETEKGTFLPMINVKGISYLIEHMKFIKKEYVLNEELNCLQLVEIGAIHQLPIKLAYALTIHKSQGLSFDEVTVDLSVPCFAKGQLYTALSRVRTPNGLKIII